MARTQWAIAVGVFLAAGAVLALKSERRVAPAQADKIAAAAAQEAPSPPAPRRAELPKEALESQDSQPPSEKKLLRLVDVGAGRRMMMPVLEGLRRDFAGRMEVLFVDVGQQREAAQKCRIRVIPTQIFYGPDGKELFRREGYWPRDAILAKWKELGFALER